jgi:hypothetical protein
MKIHSCLAALSLFVVLAFAAPAPRAAAISPAQAVPAQVPAAPTSSENDPWSSSSECPVVQTHGRWHCNCTENEVSDQICHSSKVEVQLGQKSFKVKTGTSSSHCTTSMVKPGACNAQQYNFRCCIHIGWLWDSVKCTLISQSVVQRDATENDC